MAINATYTATNISSGRPNFLNPQRQEEITAYFDFALIDPNNSTNLLPNGTLINAIQLPANAFIKDVQVIITQAFNSGTTDALVIQSDETTPKNYVSVSAALNALPLGYIASVTTNKLFVNPVLSNLQLKWTGTGTAATTGAGTVVVSYAVRNRGTFTQG